MGESRGGVVVLAGSVPSRFELEREGVRLSGLDFGGAGPPVLLMHGLAGYAGEWADTASWLTESCRVVALDARGHGDSERCPEHLTQDAHAADAAFVLQWLELGPAVVVGQSLGGQTAMVLTARRPDLVCGLVVAEASPAAGARGTLEEVMDDLNAWPVPFETHEAAVSFFGEPSRRAEAWANGLEHREGSWWPGFDPEVMARTLREALSRAYWAEWEGVSCPALVVRGTEGELPRPEAQSMVERLSGAELVEIPGAGHDLHLDRPAEWRRALEEFLSSLH